MTYVRYQENLKSLFLSIDVNYNGNINQYYWLYSNGFLYITFATLFPFSNYHYFLFSYQRGKVLCSVSIFQVKKKKRQEKQEDQARAQIVLFNIFSDNFTVFLKFHQNINLSCYSSKTIDYHHRGKIVVIHH